MYIYICIHIDIFLDHFWLQFNPCCLLIHVNLGRPHGPTHFEKSFISFCDSGRILGDAGRSLGPSGCTGEGMWTVEGSKQMKREEVRIHWELCSCGSMWDFFEHQVPPVPTLRFLRILCAARKFLASFVTSSGAGWRWERGC